MLVLETSKMKKIIYSDDQGVLHIVIPAAHEDIIKIKPEIDQDNVYKEFVWNKSIPLTAINPRYVEEADIPSSREFRNAWCDVTELSSIDIDCEKAKNIVLENIRKKREEAFKQLDQEFIMALEKGTDISDISNRKQSLRDITIPVKLLDALGKYNDREILLELNRLNVK